MLLQLQLEWRKDRGYRDCGRLLCYRVRHADLQLLPGATPSEGIRGLARELVTHVLCFEGLSECFADGGL